MTCWLSDVGSTWLKGSQAIFFVSHCLVAIYPLASSSSRIYYYPLQATYFSNMFAVFQACRSRWQCLKYSFPAAATSEETTQRPSLPMISPGIVQLFQESGDGFFESTSARGDGTLPPVMLKISGSAVTPYLARKRSNIVDTYVTVFVHSLLLIQQFGGKNVHDI